jgi:hypothetical protein
MNSMGRNIDRGTTYGKRKTKVCPVCGRIIQSLGYARHRSMHHEEKIRKQIESGEKVTFTRQGVPGQGV